MIDEVEVTERGEIVARCVDGGVWTEPHPDGHVWMHIEDAENPRMVASAVVSRDDLAAWCRRVLAEVKPDPVPTVDEAAIRADERAKVEADVLAWVDVQMRHVRTVPGAPFLWRSGGMEALGELADDIRAGKHRSTQ